MASEDILVTLHQASIHTHIYSPMSLSLNVLTTAIVIIVNVCVTLTIVLYTSISDCTPHYRIVPPHLCRQLSVYHHKVVDIRYTRVQAWKGQRKTNGTRSGKRKRDTRWKEKENLHPREIRIAFSFFLLSSFSSFSFRLDRCSFFSSLFIHLGQVLAELPQNRQKKKEESGKWGRETENSNERADT